MNVLIYAGILVIVFTLYINFNAGNNQLSLLNHKFEKQIFQKSQNLQFQIKRSATVRVWSRSSFNTLAVDTKINVS
jgi:hypothetical protein